MTRHSIGLTINKPRSWNSKTRRGIRGERASVDVCLVFRVCRSVSMADVGWKMELAASLGREATERTQMDPLPLQPCTPSSQPVSGHVPSPRLACAASVKVGPSQTVLSPLKFPEKTRNDGKNCEGSSVFSDTSQSLKRSLTHLTCTRHNGSDWLSHFLHRLRQSSATIQGQREEYSSL
jgi:hypothetical protein